MMDTPSDFQISKAAQHVVAASRAVGRGTDEYDPATALLIRDALLELWADLIGHPEDVTLALQHAYAVVLHPDLIVAAP